LGVFSGITSACCAPVLIGILTLTFLSTNFLGALSIGAIYVFGMVFPLLIISVFLGGKTDKFLILRKPVLMFKFLGKERMVIVSNLIASVIFALTGVLIIYLKAIGKLSMGNLDTFTKMITNTENYVNQYTNGNILFNVLFLVVLGGFIYYVAKKL
jgi:hypothetical protein